MRRITRLAQVFGINSVPVFGVFAADWSIGTALTLYWAETVLAIVLIWARLVLHRRRTKKLGHKLAMVGSRGGRAGRKARSTGYYSRHFLSLALFFSLGHAIFLAVLIFQVLPQHYPDAAPIDPGQLGAGMGVVSFFLLGGFLVDLPGLADRSFSAMKGLADRVFSRIVVIHLTIIFGIGALAIFDAPMALFALFAVLKTLTDLSATRARRNDDSSRARATGLVRRLGGKEKGDDFARFVERDRAERESWEETEGGSAPTGDPSQITRLPRV